MRSFLVALALLAAASAPVRAQDFRAGLSAYNVGDYATALQHWWPLAARDHAKALSGLGFLYYKGLGVPRDSAKAAALYRRAADRGAAGAQLFLGLMYLEGEGVRQSHTWAYVWCDLAVANGREEALPCRERALHHLSEDQQNRARRLVVRWYERRKAE